MHGMTLVHCDMVLQVLGPAGTYRAWRLVLAPAGMYRAWRLGPVAPCSRPGCHRTRHTAVNQTLDETIKVHKRNQPCVSCSDTCFMHSTSICIDVMLVFICIDVMLVLSTAVLWNPLVCKVRMVWCRPYILSE